MTPRPAVGAAALLVLAAVQLAVPARADGLPGGARAYFVGPECRVRAEGPLDCDPVTRVRGLRSELSQVQLVVEAGEEPLDLALGGGEWLSEQIYVPVSARSRGADPAAALPWSAAARPPDGAILGRVADPLGLPTLGAFLFEPADARARLAPRERGVWWSNVWHDGELAPARVVAPIREPAGGPRLEVITLQHEMPSPVISVFAYVERDEPLLVSARPLASLTFGEPERDGDGARSVADILRHHGVQAIDRATSVEELELQLREAGKSRLAHRDLVVLGAYGTLGEPTDDAVGRAVAMAGVIPSRVRDVVLYAVDEDCASDLPARWRERLKAEGSDAARRIRVLTTCGEDPQGVDADVVMMPAERFRPAAAAAARGQGKEVWVYNGRLPQAGPMALDAPPESMIWLGWIAARYDVRRWFLWNVNHWSDGNRGGHGPRDPYVDPETFHNADGDAVLYDGILVLPPRPPQREVLATARLARLMRGIQDASLLGLAASIDPVAAREALDLVVPRALGDVRDDEATPFGDGRAIARARSLLLDVIERDPTADRRDPAAATRRASAGLLALRATVAVHGAQKWPQSGPQKWQRRQIVAAAVVASCLGGAAIAAWRLSHRGRARRRRRVR